MGDPVPSLGGSQLRCDEVRSYGDKGKVHGGESQVGSWREEALGEGLVGTGLAEVVRRPR